jgi:hypothetical protein
LAEWDRKDFYVWKNSSMVRNYFGAIGIILGLAGDRNFFIPGSILLASGIIATAINSKK